MESKAVRHREPAAVAIGGRYRFPKPQRGGTCVVSSRPTRLRNAPSVGETGGTNRDSSIILSPLEPVALKDEHPCQLFQVRIYLTHQVRS